MGNAKSKSTMVYEALRDAIVAGRYTPGYRLTISTLAKEFGVSAVPVREAIRWLQAEGFVEYTHNVGAQVTQIDVTKYADSLRVLALLEGMATASSAPHLTGADLATARKLNDEMRFVVGMPVFDSANYRKLNEQFHAVLTSASPNSRLISLMKREAERVALMRRTSFEFDAQRSMTSVQQHHELLNLIEGGADATEIEIFARQHKLASLERSLNTLTDTEPVAGTETTTAT
ncbi:GntR family transcriptional regulator [Trueperella bialowiezensis]|uniref:DNA-binding transcriptional regulator CsiR n=1 Tax=Trueperella bialowiezensis TaxID=312285 RepID=A0A3S4YY64_9ACTO|nr:GntR family transcriptional regulator [Trueperella bialowiezensis]VEI13434.1 DNA-binding transcriptional regulator CsiR [Trueperella bialowiezensis]